MRIVEENAQREPTPRVVLGSRGFRLSGQAYASSPAFKERFKNRSSLRERALRSVKEKLYVAPNDPRRIRIELRDALPADLDAGVQRRGLGRVGRDGSHCGPVARVSSRTPSLRRIKRRASQAESIAREPREATRPRPRSLRLSSRKRVAAERRSPRFALPDRRSSTHARRAWRRPAA
jgi:hypothetical protein